MTKLKITVTQQDIDAGECCRVRRCAIALAAIQAGLFGPFITKGNIRGYTNDGKGRIIGKLPREASQFIVDFDNNRTVRPFSFTVELQPDSP